ncbi:MAG TPA: collagen-like protein [Solirubrobacterales bacterium]|nr:collagen-like protein [Solirubrobacterales bacterium]
MFSRIHNKLGTAGLVVAIVALVAALAGTAFASLPGLNSKQKKEVKKIAKKLVKVGPQGPQGAPGATGATGAPGKEGAAGTAGQNGSDGEAGACSNSKPQCVLPPGATLTGTWSFSGRGSQVIETEVGGTTNSYEIGDRREFVNISYPLRVVPQPRDFIVATNWIGENEPSTAQCPGSYSEPKAAPGELCIYAQEIVNAGENTTHEPEGFTHTDRTSGEVFNFKLNEEGLFARGYGTWAVTARCPEVEPGVEEEC